MSTELTHGLASLISIPWRPLPVSSPSVSRISAALMCTSAAATRCIAARLIDGLREVPSRRGIPAAAAVLASLHTTESVKSGASRSRQALRMGSRCHNRGFSKHLTLY